MKGLIFFGGFCFYLLTNMQASANSNTCISPQPSNFEEVFQCISMHGSSSFANVSQMNCAQIKQQYLGLLKAAGAKKELIAKPPQCSTFAKVVLEVSGHKPYWQSCLNYDGSKQHFSNCLGGMLKNTTNQTVVASCLILNTQYELLLLAVSEDLGRPTLPPRYTKLDCDDMIQALTSHGITTIGEECSGFTPNNIPQHIQQCLASDIKFKTNIEKIDCNSLRNYYQTRLRMIYGKIPDGYKMQKCSQLNIILEQLKQYSREQDKSEVEPLVNSLPTHTVKTVSKIPQSANDKITRRRQARLHTRNSKVQDNNITEKTDISSSGKSRDRLSTEPSNVTTVKPQLIVKKEARYPLRARSKNIEGWVKLSFSVNTKGQVEGIKVIAAEPEGIFERSAKQALKTWKYKPVVIDGKAISTSGLEETIEFNL